jgi:hypothetical protein
MDKLKNQLTAAVAISAGTLIASGYLITWARLANVDAPSRAVLSALSTSYYLGVALESLLLLLVVLAVVGIGFFLAQSTRRTRDALRDWPSRFSWVVLGLLIAAIGLFTAGWPISILLASHTHAGYRPATIGLGAAVVGLAYLVWRLGKPLELKGPVAMAAAVLLLSTVSAVGFKLVNAWLGPTPFPEAAAWMPHDDCVTPEAERGRIGCGFIGFYVGEDSTWVYLVRTPLNCEGDEYFPPRLILVPRDKALDLAVSEKLRASSPACPLPSPKEEEQEAEMKKQGEEKEAKTGNEGVGDKEAEGKKDKDSGGKDQGKQNCPKGQSSHPPSTPLTEPSQSPARWMGRTQTCHPPA